MSPNPALGVVFHWLGGLASGSFYVPYRAVKHWSWETYWLAGGVVSWIIGVLRGFGGLTFGLTMRCLSMSRGRAMVLGYCAAFGTIVPPVFHGESKLPPSRAWIWLFVSLFVLVPSTVIVGYGNHLETLTRQ
jgi:L-rhamnose-H+ transport protein